MSWGRFQDHRPTRPSSMSVSTTRSETESSTATLSPSSEPIPITPSSFSQPSDQQTSFDSSASFISQAVDGPLQGLLPAFDGVAISSGSSSDGSAELGLGALARGEGRISFARRVVSAPMPCSTSPGSPLAASSSPDPTSSSPRRRSAQFPLAGSTPLRPTPSSDSLHPSPTSRRRRSSVSLSSSTGSAPPFGSFVGSFEQSLLSGRLSTLPSLPLPFLASIGVLGSADAPTRLRCPPHLNDVPFGAFYYSSGEGTKSSAPYVGTVELDSHYLSLLQSTSISSFHPPPSPAPALPRFPGYQVPARGQVQLVIKNAHSTAIKLFLIPFDLTTLTPGTKTFLRQKSYTVETSAGDDTKGRLRYAVHLQFCCPATKAKERKFYLHGNLRVVFASRGLDSTEKLRVVSEGPEGAHILSDGLGQATIRHAPYSGPGLEWEMAKKKVKEREKLRVLGLGDQVEERPQEMEREQPALATSTRPPHFYDPDGTHFGLSPVESFSSSLEVSRPLKANAATSEGFSPAHLLPSVASSPSPFASPAPRKLPRSSLALSFERPASPVPTFLKSRTPSMSGLASSKPPSRAGSDGSESGSGSGRRRDVECGR